MFDDRGKPVVSGARASRLHPANPNGKIECVTYDEQVGKAASCHGKETVQDFARAIHERQGFGEKQVEGPFATPGKEIPPQKPLAECAAQLRGDPVDHLETDVMARCRVGRARIPQSDNK